MAGILDRWPLKFLKRQSAPQQPDSSWYAWPFAKESGVLVTHETAMTFDAVYACVRWLSSMVAMLPWGLYEKVGERKRKQLHNDTSWLIEQAPNSEMNTFQFRELLMVWAPTWGNGYAEIERSDLTGKPIALWPIAPDRVRIRRDRPSGDLWYEITNQFNGEARRIEQRDMFHIRGPGYDGMQGYSPVALAARTIGMGIALELYGGNFFGNGARPSGILSLEGHADPERLKQLKEAWEAAHGGSAKSGRTAVVPKGVNYTPISVTNADGKMVELDEAIVRKVCRWFGVPPHKVFDLENAHFSNIEHQSIEAVTDSLMPWMVRFELEFNGKILGRNQQGRQYSKLNANALMRGDSAARANYYKTMLMSGVLSINDVLELEDRNDIGALGDDRYMQMQFTTLERISEGTNLNKGQPVGEAPEEDGDAKPEPDTQTDTDSTTEPLTVQINPDRKQTSTDSVAVDVVLEPLMAAAFGKFLLREQNEAKNAVKRGFADDAARERWIFGFGEKQAELARKEFAPVVEAHRCFTGVTTDVGDWVAYYNTSVPARLQKAVKVPDAAKFYSDYRDDHIGGLLQAAKEFARSAKS